MPDIKNPILKGFNPDPSILRVGDDYYIATSTFEWFPGVQIHHSRDLKNWRLLTRPLRRASQLNMLGDPDSCGIWAPCLSHDGDQFYLIYTDVKRYGRTSVGGAAGASLRDFHNYMVTAATIDGEWSDPIAMNSSGFDPSLFHDDDGKKWFVNMLWDHRPGQNRFAGIVAQEYSLSERKLVGERVNIFKGTPLGLTEAPHLYKRDGFYYLLTAEGGTAWNHAVTMARSKNLLGPYELHPDTLLPRAALTHPCSAGRRLGGNAGRRHLHGLSQGRPLNRGRCNSARPQSENAMARWLALQKVSRPAALETLAPVEAASFFRSRRARGFRHPVFAHRFAMAAHALSKHHLRPDGAAGHAALWPRAIGSLFTGVGGAASAIPLLQPRQF